MQEVYDNEEKRRFELRVGADIALADYRIEGDSMYILHVQTPESLRGMGIAGKLMEGVIAHIRTKKLKAIPVCSYAAHWLKKHS